MATTSSRRWRLTCSTLMSSTSDATTPARMASHSGASLSHTCCANLVITLDASVKARIAAAWSVMGRPKSTRSQRAICRSCVWIASATGRVIRVPKRHRPAMASVSMSSCRTKPSTAPPPVGQLSTIATASWRNTSTSDSTRLLENSGNSDLRRRSHAGPPRPSIDFPKKDDRSNARKNRWLL